MDQQEYLREVARQMAMKDGQPTWRPDVLAAEQELRTRNMTRAQKAKADAYFEAERRYYEDNSSQEGWSENREYRGTKMDLPDGWTKPAEVTMTFTGRLSDVKYDDDFPKSADESKSTGDGKWNPDFGDKDDLGTFGDEDEDEDDPEDDGNEDEDNDYNGSVEYLADVVAVDVATDTECTVTLDVMGAFDPIVLPVLKEEARAIAKRIGESGAFSLCLIENDYDMPDEDV